MRVHLARVPISPFRRRALAGLPMISEGSYRCVDLRIMSSVFSTPA